MGPQLSAVQSGEGGSPTNPILFILSIPVEFLLRDDRGGNLTGMNMMDRIRKDKHRLGNMSRIGLAYFSTIGSRTELGVLRPRQMLCVAGL